MACECGQAPARSVAERATVRTALTLNATMFVVGLIAGYLADSTGVLADALDMGTDAVAYALALMATTRGQAFKQGAARWTGGVLLALGAGIAAEAIRRAIYGSEPVGLVMMAYSVASFGVNVYVLRRLSKYRNGEVHMRASYICTRADVIANFAVFVSGVIVALTRFAAVDLIVGFGIGIYVLKEALEIIREANEASEAEGV
jgi:Co/Zn/Cd efflux system component